MINGEALVILLVEDNLDQAELVMRNMEDAKVANRIIHLEDGRAALDYLYGNGQYADREEFPIPHLVLLDLRLPKVDGLQVLKQVKEDTSLCAIPMVVLTTSDAERDIVLANEYHANSYVTKPVNFPDFSRMLRELGFYWLAWHKRSY